MHFDPLPTYDAGNEAVIPHHSVDTRDIGEDVVHFPTLTLNQDLDLIDKITEALRNPK